MKKLSPKTKFAIGIALYLFGLIYLFTIIALFTKDGILGNQDGLGMDNYPVVFISVPVITVSSMIAGCVFIGISGFQGTKKKKFDKYKWRVFSEFIFSFFFIIFSLVGIIYFLFFETGEKIKYLAICSALLIFGVLSFFYYLKKVKELIKERNKFKKVDFKITNAFDLFMYDYYKDAFRSKMRKYVDKFSVIPNYDSHFKQLNVLFKNERLELIFFINKKDLYYSVNLDHDFDDQIIEAIKKAKDSKFTVEYAENLFYGEDTFKIGFIRGDFENSYQELGQIAGDIISKINELYDFCHESKSEQKEKGENDL